MSKNILYYSNYCDNSKKLLQILSQTSIQKEIHFICIDKRVNMPDGSIHVILKDGSQVLLPPTVTKVPALMLVNNGFHILFGDQIYQHLQPKEKIVQNQATNFQGEPDAFTFNNFSTSGISSDQYSFLDMPADELLAKGSGGTRQMFNYAMVEDNGMGMNIQTPPDDYSPDKVNESAIEQYQQQRNQLKQ
jgi:hypothetical protein